MEVKGEELIQVSSDYTFGNSFKIGREAAIYIGGTATVWTGILRTSTEVDKTS